jgi:3-hydroxyisobutyrate dehydrogenase
VGDENDVAAVVLGSEGVASHLAPGAWVIDFSTIGPRAAQQIAQQLAAIQIGFLDAPVSGGDVGAQNGTLTIMVGGDPEGYERVLPLLRAVGRTLRHCGPVGSGQAVKLCNQVLCASQMVGLCEAIALARSQNLDPQLMIDICQTGAAGSWALSNLGPKIVAQDYAPGFMAAHLLKDLRLVLETWGAPTTLPGTHLAQGQFQRIGDRHQGTQALAQVYGLGTDQGEVQIASRD